MNAMKTMTKLLAVGLAAATLTTMAVLPAAATTSEDVEVTRITNPEGVPGETDGLVGDRETSYAWCMAARGNYVYIGTNKNIVGSAVESIAAQFEAQGLSHKAAWHIVDVITAKEVPHPETDEGGQILRVDCLTNEVEVIYTAPAGTSFRMAITHGNNVYFGSYSTTTSFTVDNEKGLSNDIFCIDPEDNVEKVFESFDGTSMRAACEMGDTLFFGGVDASEEIAEGWEGSAKLAILAMNEEDNTKWDRVADYRDFGLRYATDPSLNSAAASPIWDICAYNGDLYATLPGTYGFSVFKGHPASTGEEANEYGWTWTEVVGFENGVNPIGLKDTNLGGPLSVVATPVVFNGDLYLFDFDHTIGAVTTAMQGIVAGSLGAEVKASDYLRPLYNTLQHTQSLWKLDNETGKFEKVQAFSDLLEGTTNEYVWRAEIYNDNLYITTMDSAVLYNYVTKLTNGSFVNMTEQEWKNQISAILELSTLVIPDGSEEVQAGIDELQEAYDELQALLDSSADATEVEQYIEDLQAAEKKVKDAAKKLEKAFMKSAAYQKVSELVTTACGISADAIVELAAKVKAYMQKNGAPDEVLLHSDNGDVDFSTMSAQEIEAYYAGKQEELIAYFEAMKINIPELRMMDTNEIVDLIIRSIAKVMSSDEVQNYIQKVQDAKQERAEAAAKRKAAYRKILNFFFTDLPDLDAYDAKIEDAKAELKAKISAKIGEQVIKAIKNAYKKLGEDVEEYNAKAAEVNAQIEAVEAKLVEVSDNAQAAINAIDWKGLAMYTYINERVAHDTWGFDMVRTSDGENFEIVTDDGFGDKYNYGGRSMVATPYGLYLGTANPFYGAQLYRINDAEPEEELVNLSTVTENVKEGERIVVTGAAEGGSGDYTYSYYYKRSTGKVWKAIGAEDTTATSASFKVTAAGDIDVKVVVKDSDGHEAEQLMSVVVAPDSDLANNSTINGEELSLGQRVVVTTAASGGSGEYTWKISYKRTSSNYYKEITMAEGSNTASFKPTSAGEFEVVAEVTDSDNISIANTFTVTIS